MGCGSEAGKTGTSEGESDAWFVGYTPLYSTAVWVGHPQSRELTGFGGPTAGPIWQNYMTNAVAGECPEFEVPSSLPELSGLKSGHTRSSSEVSNEEESEESESEGKEKKKQEKEEKAEEGEGEAEEEAPEPEPDTDPDPDAQPGPATPSRRRRQRRLTQQRRRRDRNLSRYSPISSIR